MKGFVFLALCLMPLVLSAAVDERKTDLYFANGILTEEWDADKNALLLRDSIRAKHGADYFNTHFGEKVHVAYNSTDGMGWDVWEAIRQKFSSENWIQFFLELNSMTAHGIDLRKQIRQYKTSIEMGRSVLVVAHSQGNLFTYHAYNIIESWMKDYFEVISVASPGFRDIKPDTKRISWDNDMVAHISLPAIQYGYDLITNPVRSNDLITNPVRSINLSCKLSDVVLCPPLPFDSPVYSYFDEFSLVTDAIDRFFWTASDYNWDQKVHAFGFYMGQELIEGKDPATGDPILVFNPITEKPLKTNVAKNLILAEIDRKLSSFQSLPSQWQKSADVGCGCNTRIHVEHKYDAALNVLMDEVDVVAFNEGQKLYPIDRQYYIGPYNGVDVEDHTWDKTGDLCMALFDVNDKKVGTLLGKEASATPRRGEVEVTLSWDNGGDYRLRLAMPGSVKDVSNCNMEHVYVASRYQIKPGSYAVSVSRGLNKTTESGLEGTYYVSIKTPSVTKLLEVDANREGHIADINVRYVNNKPQIDIKPSPLPLVRFSGGVPPKSVSHRGLGSRFSFLSSFGNGGFSGGIPESAYTPSGPGGGPGRGGGGDNGHSCGSRPCVYWITEYISSAMLGPLSGADVSVFSLDGFRTGSPLYQGKTSSGDTLYTAGRLDIPESLIATLDDDLFYVIAVKGGVDIDVDDDMRVDPVPTPNLGTIHALITGEQLKELKPKVNILTEVAFQVMKEDIHADTLSNEQMVDKLGEIAERLLRSKIYVYSDEALGNADLLHWMPTIHKDLLHVNYDKRVVPIVRNVLLGLDISQSAYDLVYSPDSVAPLLRSGIFRIAEDAPLGSHVGDVIALNLGVSDIVEMEIYGEGSEKFSINQQGVISLAAGLDFETTQFYELFVRARNDAGFGEFSAVYIQVEDVLDAPYALSFDFEYLYADAPIGTKVGKIVFDQGDSPITSMQLTGQDSSYFSIDDQGVVVTLRSLEDFYDKKAYFFDIVALNNSGSSLPASIVINIGDRRDIPVIDRLFAHVDENSPPGTVVGQVPVISDGDSPIIGYSLTGTDQFSVDSDGTVRVAPNAVLDYESKPHFSFSVTASNLMGESRPQTVSVSLNDLPDVIPVLRGLNLSVNKETDVGSIIGNVLTHRGDSAIVSFSLAPDSPFSVDHAGNLRIVGSLLEQHSEAFVLQASATNHFGTSEAVEVNISVIGIPLVSDFSGTAFYGSSEGTSIGGLDILRNGNTIDSITLSGEGSGDFRVDLEGKIRVAHGVTLSSERQSLYSLTVTVNGQFNADVRIDVLDRILSSMQTLYSVNNITLSADGTKAFVAQGPTGSRNMDGVMIVDVTDPKEPIVLGRIYTPGAAYDVRLSADGTKAFIVHYYGSPYIHNSGLRIVDITDVSAPVFIGSVSTPRGARGVVLSEDERKALVVDGDAGVHVVDITDLSAPIIVGSIKTAGIAVDARFGLGDNLAFVVADSTVQVIDLREPTVPVLISTISLPGKDERARWIVLSADRTRAFVATSNPSYLHFIDIADPKVPSILGSVGLSGAPNALTLSADGSRAFVLSNSGLQVVDVDDPTVSTLIGLISVSGNGVGILDDSNMAIVTNHVGFNVLDMRGIDVPDKVPGIIGFSAIVEENTQVGGVIGQVKIVYTGSGGITSLKLIGEGADDFSINEQGVVTLKRALDYSAKSRYLLSAIASNAFGDRHVEVALRVRSIPELEDFTGEVASMASEGTYVGQIDMWVDDNTTLTDIALIGEGAENFVLDSDGKISVSLGAELHHFIKPRFQLKAMATNQYGTSQEASVIINVSSLMSDYLKLAGVSHKVKLSADKSKAYVWGGGALEVLDTSVPSSPVLIGRLSAGGYGLNFALSDDSGMLFFANGPSGLGVVDVAIPTMPVRLDSINTSINVSDIALSNDGRIAFLSSRHEGFQIIDLGDPSEPVVLGSYNDNMPNSSAFALSAFALSVDGSKAFVIRGSSLVVFDVADLTSPAPIGSVHLEKTGGKIQLSADGTRAFVVLAEGYTIFDVTDPSAPVKIGGNALVLRHVNIVDLTLSESGQIAFITLSNGDLQIIDVSDPTRYAPIRLIRDLGSIRTGLSYDESMMFVTRHYLGSYLLQGVDLNGLNVPDKVPGIIGFSTFVGENTPVGSVIGQVKIVYTGSGGITSLKLIGEGADDFSINEQGVVTLKRALDYSAKNIYHLRVVASNALGDRDTYIGVNVNAELLINDFNAEVKSRARGGAYVGKVDMHLDANAPLTDIALIGDGAENFVLDYDGNIYVSFGAELHHLIKPRFALKAIATNQYGSKEANIVIDVSPFIASVENTNDAYSVYLSDDETKAFLADGLNGFKVIDISVPTAPFVIGSVSLGDAAQGMALSVDGSKAFVTTAAGLQIIDLNNPFLPVVLGSIDTPDSAFGVSLSADGRKAFVSVYNAGLQVVDVSDPTEPVILASIDTIGEAGGVSLSADGRIAFVTAGHEGLLVIDVSEPTVPEILGSIKTAGFADGVSLSVDGVMAFVVSTLGLEIIDVRDPRSPLVLSLIDTPGIFVELSVDETKAFVGNGEFGLHMIDISNPISPLRFDSFNFTGWSIRLSSDGSMAFVADGDYGLRIIDLIGLE